jgi:serine/threonine protein kinase
LEGNSLSEVLSVNPVWWTLTGKAKVVAGLVLGLRFAHSLGLFHGCLTTNNILFDFDHCIHIVDFNPIQFEIATSENEREIEDGRQLAGFSRERLTRENDIEAFASILFELVVGRPVNGETSVPANIPTFVLSIIE